LWLAASSLLAACGSSASAPVGEPSASATARHSATAVVSASPSVAAPTSEAETPTPEAAAPLPTPVASSRSITISAVGDVSLARQVVDWMELYGPGYPYELVAPLLTGDIVFGNLEGALTDRGEPWPKAFNFRTPPQYASGLAAAGFDVVALANNHAMDFGVVGLQDTIAALGSVGISQAGAGTEQMPARLPATIDINGLTVAFFACVLTPDEGSGFSIGQWEWTPENKTGLYVCDSAFFSPAIRLLDEIADFVVVSVHAGDEYVNAPNATQRELAEAALAAGADVVLGHHAHVVQPVEQRGGQLIAWGLGNFVFDLDQWDLAGIPEPRVSLILNITLTAGAGVTSWEAVPVVLDAEQDRPRPATPGEAAVLESLIEP
jgi:poly-gamma-glutamate synthesis protein (capsule biosynthesis protein)